MLNKLFNLAFFFATWTLCVLSVYWTLDPILLPDGTPWLMALVGQGILMALSIVSSFFAYAIMKRIGTWVFPG